MKKKLALLFLTTITLFACSNEIKTSLVETEMPVSDLIDTMGEPDYIENDSDVLYKEVKPVYHTLLQLEQEAKSVNAANVSSEEQARYQRLAITLKEVSNIMNAINQGNEISRYDYLDEKVESTDGEIGEADMEAYILNGRVIYKRFVASE